MNKPNRGLPAACLVTVLACLIVGKSSLSSEPTRWQNRMQDLYKTLVDIVTETSSDKAFQSASGRELEKNARKLALLAHEISKQPVPPDADPTMKVLAAAFRDETQRAYEAMKSGDKDYARHLLSGITGYCIACHTRNNSGPSFAKLPLEPTPPKGLFLVEQGRFFAATRQFDRALDSFDKILDDPMNTTAQSAEWGLALRYGLAITVRVKKDPDQAIALIEKVLESRGTPFYMKQDALKWKESLVKWKNETPRNLLTEEGLHAEAIRLVAEAHEMQRYPADHSAEIAYLRASSAVHDLLQTAPDGQFAGDALLMAGICYESLRAFDFDDLHEIYYDACVRKVPHSTTAESCYHRYQESVYQGFTGSAGTYLPPDVSRTLHELEDLAHPIPSKQN